MFCTNCGEQMPDDSLFCTACGEKLAFETEGETQIQTEGKTNKQPRSFKGGKVAAAGISAVLLCGLAVVLVVNSRPKTVVLRGFSTTWKAVLTEESGVARYLGLQQLTEAVENGKTKQTMELEVLADSLNIGMKSELKKDGSERLLVNNELTSNGISMLDGSLYYDKEKTAAILPKLYSRSFYVNHEELKEKLSNSQYLAQINNYFDLKLGKMDFENTDWSKEYWDASADDWKALYKNMKVEKLKKKSFAIGGKDKACKGYKLTVDKSDLKNVTEDFWDVSIENSILVNSVSLSSWMDSSAVKQELKRNSKNLIANIKKDLELEIYIGPKGRIVSISGEYPFNDSGRIVTLKGNAAMTGKNNPLDSLEVQAEIASGVATTLQVSLIRNLEDSNEAIRDTAELNLYEPSSSYAGVSMTADMELDKKGGNWNLDFGMQESEYTYSAFAEGTMENVKKGKSFAATLDDAGISAYGMRSPAINMSASYAIEPLKEAIEEDSLEEPEVNLLNLTDEEMDAIGTEILRNLNNSNWPGSSAYY